MSERRTNWGADAWADMAPDVAAMYIGAFCPLELVYEPPADATAFHCVEGEFVIEPGDPPVARRRVIVAVPGPRPGLDTLPSAQAKALARWVVRAERRNA